MNIVGRVTSVWRYPVKSMAGEAVDEAFIGFAGVYGDRIYALLNAGAPPGFPYFTGRNQREMLLYRPRFRNVTAAQRPPNQSEAEGLGPGLTPLYASPDELAVDVVTPSGAVMAIDDPALHDMLRRRGTESFSIVRSDRAITDCRPISLISLQTIRQIGDEVGAEMDTRRFRANIYVDLGAAAGFAEDAFVGRKLQIGERVSVAVLARDPRCKMISIDPDSGQEDPKVFRTVSRGHGGDAGVYCATLSEGTVRAGDAIVLVD